MLAQTLCNLKTITAKIQSMKLTMKLQQKTRRISSGFPDFDLIHRSI